MSLVSRRAAALLEVLVAVTLIATTGIAFLELARHGTAAVSQLASREAELRAADEILRRADVGLRAGEWATDLRIERNGLALVVAPSGPGLWRMTVVEPISGRTIVSTRMRGRSR
jgi:type II secretory pathway component PulJ